MRILTPLLPASLDRAKCAEPRERLRRLRQPPNKLPLLTAVAGRILPAEGLVSHNIVGASGSLASHIPYHVVEVTASHVLRA